MVKILELIQINKSFTCGSIEKVIMKDFNLIVESGEVVSLIGKSGIGKSTLLQIGGLLDRPISGSVVICGTHCNNAGIATKMRRKNIGFVYQAHHLLSEFNVLENIMIPLLLNGYSKIVSKKKAISIIERVFLEDHIYSNIFELSGGERQRVAVARALVHGPKIIIADEPTGNLDPENSDKIFSLLISCVEKQNSALLVATHNLSLAKKAHRIITIKNGAAFNVDRSTI